MKKKTIEQLKMLSLTKKLKEIKGGEDNRSYMSVDGDRLDIIVT